MIKEFEQELQRYQEPGYRSRYDDEFAEDGRATTTVDEAELQLPKPHLGQPHGSSNDQLASPSANKNTREDTGTSVEGNQSRASDQEATHEVTENASAENFGQVYSDFEQAHAARLPNRSGTGSPRLGQKREFISRGLRITRVTPAEIAAISCVHDWHCDRSKDADPFFSDQLKRCDLPMSADQRVRQRNRPTSTHLDSET